MSAAPPRTPLQTVRRLLGYFRPHRAGLALALVLIAAHSAIPGLLVLLIERVLDDVLIEKDQALLAVMPFAVVGLYALNGALGFARGMLTRSIAWSVVTRLRSELFRATLRQDAAWHQAQSTGGLLARLTNDVQNIQYGVSGIVTAVQKPLTLMVLLGAAFYLNPRLAAIAVFVLPAVAIPIARFGRRLRHSTRATLDNLARLSGEATETLTGVRTVKTNAGEQARISRFDAENERQRDLQMAAFAARLMPSPIVEVVAAVGVAIVIWVGGQQVFAGEIAPGELIAFMVALGLLNDPLKGIAEIQSLTQRAIAGADVVFNILDRPSDIPDTGTAVPPSGPIDLRFEGVHFDYGEGDVLAGLDLHIAPGQVVALVGASGAGKSTAATLVPRLADPTGGRVTLAGRDIREYRLADLRRAVAVVSQDSFLFDDTIRNNIAFGMPDATDAEVLAAATAANAHDFIMATDHGYDTRVAELGQRLSGGQRQRICIARAILRDAPVLVLDEATSALDAESEAVVQAALDNLVADRTVLAIAHRLSTIRDAHQILVLDDGRVVERGTHAELIAAAGPYARLVARQSDPS